MARPALTEAITRIAEPAAASVGLAVWGVEVLQAGRPVVRIFVDAPWSEDAARSDASASKEPEGSGGEAANVEAVSIDQCVRISRMVGLALDVEEIFASAYVLEVSSPGLSRAFFRFEQLAPYVGDALEVLLLEASAPGWPGRKKFRGTLRSAAEGRLILALEDERDGERPLLDVAWEQVRRVVRIHIFPEPEKPGRKKRAP